MTARLTQGSPAPGFTLPDSDGNDVSLQDFATATTANFDRLFWKAK